VASVPAPGPIDLIKEGVNGAVDNDLHSACLRAIRCTRQRTRDSVVGRTLRAGHDLFRSQLVPVMPQIPILVPEHPAHPGPISASPDSLPSHEELSRGEEVALPYG